MVQLGAGPPAVVGLLPQPLGAHFDPTAAGLAAAGPVGPLTELTVRRAGDDAGLLDVACTHGGTGHTAHTDGGQSMPGLSRDLSLQASNTHTNHHHIQRSHILLIPFLSS